MTEQKHRENVNTFDEVAPAINRLRTHYSDVVLPMWREPGFDVLMGLPHEALQAVEASSVVRAAANPVRFRAMACARQLYVFSEAGDRIHADRLFASLIRHFRDAAEGGFFYSVDQEGQPLDTNKDLYTHAFVIFACAAYLRRFRSAAARQIVETTIALVTDRFPKDVSSGLSHAVVSSDFKTVLTPPRQNPLMHLTEAYLLAREAIAAADGLEQSENAKALDELLDTLLHNINRTFVDEATGCVLELPILDRDNWLEPGHQFEWFYLAYGSKHQAFKNAGLYNKLASAFDFAQRYGVDPVSGGVAASLNKQGQVVDAQQRIWAQTEYLRALSCHPSTDQRAKLASQIGLFETRFLHNAGWHEIIAVDNSVLRHDMPSSTPYHLASSYDVLP